jgi:phage baseplate assembly protein W
MADEVWATVEITADLGFQSNPSPPHNSDISVKHFSFPFTLGPNKHARAVEQDSDDDIMGCVEAVCRTQIGQRIEVPEFGLPDQTFAEGGPDPTMVERAVETWEERCAAEVAVEVDGTDMTKYHLTVDVDPGGGSL